MVNSRLRELFHEFKNSKPGLFTSCSTVLLIFLEWAITNLLDKFVAFIQKSFYLYVIKSDNEINFDIATQLNDMLDQLVVIKINVFRVLFLIMALITIVIVIISVHQINERKKNDSIIAQLKSQIKDLNSQQDKDATEFANLKSFADSHKKVVDYERLLSILADYVNETQVVDSIQLYTCPFLPEPEDVDANEMISLTFRYKDGTASDKSNVNALLSASYQIAGEIYCSFYGLLKEQKDYFSEYKLRLDKEKEHYIQKKAIDLYKKIADILNSIDGISTIKDEHYCYYRILEILAEIILTDDKDEATVECKKLLSLSEAVEMQLKTGRRTGLLGVLFLQSTYYFGNENSSVKRNRGYFASPFDFKGDKLVMLVVLRKSELRLESGQTEVVWCKKIYDEIETLLCKELSERSEI